MNLSQLRKQFHVFIFMGSADHNTELKAFFNEAGYESTLFKDQENLLLELRQSPPHLILFSPLALATPLSAFVTQVLEQNSEIQFVCVAGVEQAAVISEYRELNFSGFVPAGAELAVRCLWQVDQICENLVRTYQAENLFEEKEKLMLDRASTQENLQQTIAQNRSLSVQTEKAGVGSLTEKAKSYDGLSSKDEYLTAFLLKIPCRAIYFKYLPTVNSFVAVSGHGIDIETIKGVGARMSVEESKDPVPMLMSGKLPQSLQEIVQDGLQISEFLSKPVPVHRSLDGLFVFWGEPGFDYKEIENEFVLFLLFYQRAHLQKQTEGLQIQDSVTELYNRNYFYQKLDEEIARSRRLKKPISVIRMSVDHLMEIEHSFGPHHRDVVLRTIGTIVKKTSRVNDLSCRTEENQISLILPHCSRRGAALRAERLRRIIEAHIFSTIDLKISVSCGVSEYPTLSQNALDLDASATKALDFIVEKGGNKVCLYKPVDGFKPDFEVTP